MIDLEIVTFATLGKGVGFRDYSKILDSFVLEAQLQDINIRHFDQEVFKHSSYSRFDKYKGLRKGAGYWTWKPLAIRQASLQSSKRYLLYVDVDNEIININHDELIDSLSGNPLAVYELNDLITDWSSRSCLKFFGDNNLQGHKSVAAGLILIDTEHREFEEWLSLWEVHLDQPKLLLDPVFSIKNRHRHDQTILSSLIAIGSISAGRLPSSCFLERGYMSPTFNFSDSTTAFCHGRIGHLKLPPKGRLAVTIIFHKYQLVQFWVRYFLVKIINLGKR